ncbi:hypothetical protein NZ47_05420 [Anaerovibrio lipolyticus]|uniref:Uncharacterized protein n=2 Tax=Anaerovibrio lipolyticus TaxID=82374 RepID=A0A0B2JXM9_9FIRM|nr:hypothetical protein NZ47_05420 [Anaerovibrio lipolyticus]
MMAMVFVNVSAVEAYNIGDLAGGMIEQPRHECEIPRDEDHESQLKVEHLRGTYRIAEVYSTGYHNDGSFEFKPEDIGTVIKIYYDGYLKGKIISAPVNSRFTRVMEELNRQKEERNDPSLIATLIWEIHYQEGDYSAHVKFNFTPGGLEMFADKAYADKSYFDKVGNVIVLYEDNVWKGPRKSIVLEKIDTTSGLNAQGYLTKPVEQPRTPSSTEAKPNIRYHVENVYLNSPGVATIEGYFANDGNIDGYAKLVELDLTLTADNGQQMWAYSGIRHDVNIEVPANKYVNYTYYVQHKNIPEYHKRFKWKATTNTHSSTKAG